MNEKNSSEMEVSSGSVTLCDVRLGPTEDKIEVSLGNGIYLIQMEKTEKSVEYSSILIHKKKAKIAGTGKQLGDLSVDGSVIGLYETPLFERYFKNDPIEFYNWGESYLQIEDNITKCSFSILPFEFVCIPTFKDGAFKVLELINAKNENIGIKIKLDSIENEDHYANDFMYRFIICADDEMILWLDKDYDTDDILDCLIDSFEDYIQNKNIENEKDSSKLLNKFISKLDFIRITKFDSDDKGLIDREIHVQNMNNSYISDKLRFCLFLKNLMNDDELLNSLHQIK